MSSLRNGNRYKLLFFSVLGVVICAGVVLAILLLAPFSPLRLRGPQQPPDDPQYAALLQLESASQQPPNFYFQNGFPRYVNARVPAAGLDPAERARSFLLTYGDLYRQSNPDLALEVKRVSGSNGEIVTFYQTYKSLPILASEIVVMLSGDQVVGTVGGLITAIDLDTTPAISDRDAEDLARSALSLPDAGITAPTTLLVYDQSLMDGNAPDPHLAWRVDLQDGLPWEVFVDAHTAAVLQTVSLSEGSAGLEDFDLYLVDANGQNGYDTECYWGTGQDDSAGDEGAVDNDYWNDDDANSAWYSARYVYLFYHDTFGRHSYDGEGDDLELYIHAGATSTGSTKAWWINMWCGELIDTQNGFPTTDVIGHEFTHGVIDYTSDLWSALEPGALDEGYSDVMGVLADPPDWNLGEGINGSPTPVRDLTNPAIDTYADYEISTEDHDGGGIIGKAAYLISEGGTHNGVTVTGIGSAKTGDLFYLVMVSLPSGAQFIDARNFSVMGADLMVDTLPGYDFTASDVCQVRNAFYSVGLGNPDLNCNGQEEDPDPDGDSALVPNDNCPFIFNPGQEDDDLDGIGNVCDSDDDGDGVPEIDVPGDSYLADNCPGINNPDQTDANFNGLGKECDPDEDSDFDHDTLLNWDDNCPFDPNADPLGDYQNDVDSDGFGDACDPDTDGDGLSNDDDNCPFTPNPIDVNGFQPDDDQDGAGNACDKCPKDKDVTAWTAGIPELGIDPQPIQPDSDEDGTPNACDLSFRVGGSPWVKDLLPPDGSSRTVDVEGDPRTFVELPIPTCDPDHTGWFSPNYRQAITVEGLDENVRVTVIGVDGKSVGGNSYPGQTQQLDFAPQGGTSYFMVLSFGPEYPPGQMESFDVALSCGYAEDQSHGSAPETGLTPSATLDHSATPSSTTTPAPTSTPTPTSIPAQPPTEVPAPTATDAPAPTDVPAATETETPPDLSGPSIGEPNAKPNPNGLPVLCRQVPPTVVKVKVVDPSGVGEVKLHVTYREVEQVIGMSGPGRGGNYSGDWEVPQDANGGQATYFIEAVDALGNRATGGNGVIELSRTVCP